MMSNAPTTPSNSRNDVVLATRRTSDGDRAIPSPSAPPASDSHINTCTLNNIRRLMPRLRSIASLLPLARDQQPGDQRHKVQCQPANGRKDNDQLLCQRLHILVKRLKAVGRRQVHTHARQRRNNCALAIDDGVQNAADIRGARLTPIKHQEPCAFTYRMLNARRNRPKMIGMDQQDLVEEPGRKNPGRVARIHGSPTAPQPPV